MKIEHRFLFFIFQLSEKMNDPNIHAFLKPLTSNASSKVKNKSDAIRNRISDFVKRHISKPKTQ